MTNEEKKFQEFLSNNNISEEHAKKHVKWKFDDGQLTLLELYYVTFDGTVSFKDFPNLKVLHILWSDITDIDLTQNINLKDIMVHCGDLTNIDLTKNCNLKYLKLNGNKLTNIDLTKNSKLEELFLYNNKLTNIDLTQNTELRKFDLEDNNLTTVDLTHNTELEDVAIDPKVETKMTGEILYRLARY